MHLENYLLVPAHIKPQDLTDSEPDSKSMQTYLSGFHHYYFGYYLEINKRIEQMLEKIRLEEKRIRKYIY